MIETYDCLLSSRWSVDEVCEFLERDDHFKVIEYHPADGTLYLKPCSSWATLHWG